MDNIMDNKIIESKNVDQTPKVDNEKILTKIQRYQFIDRMLNESFPMAFLLTLALFNIFNGSTLIGLQILSVIYRTPFFYIAVGY